MGDEVLKKGTLKCPKDKEDLHFELMYGMKIARMDSITKELHLNAKCPKCGNYYKVVSAG